MLGWRTPTKSRTAATEGSRRSTERERHEGSPTKKTQTSVVRRSIGEWEAGSAKQTPLAAPSTIEYIASQPPQAKISGQVAVAMPKEGKKGQSNRVLEARACLNKAKLVLGQSKNIKTEIKNDVIKEVERLYQLVKEGAAEKSEEGEVVIAKETSETSFKTCTIENRLEELHTLIKNNNEKMEMIHAKVSKQSDDLESLANATKTYASAVVGHTKSVTHERTAALHSVLISSEIETDSGEEVLNKVRISINAREKGIRVERVKKVKDGKVIVSCSTEAERQKVEERLKDTGRHLKVTEIKNRDPLLLLRDVLNYNGDEDLRKALRRQNGHLFKDLDEAEARVELCFRKKTRNPHASHVVIRVSPKIWQRVLEVGVIYIDLQKVKVEDQSPLVQCSQCLGYGHSRRFCKDPVERCSHCGGPHLRGECGDLQAGVEPQCCNCIKAKLANSNHNAFSAECQIRRKWDALARASVAYC